MTQSCTCYSLESTTQTPSTTVPLREGAARETADSLALKLSRLSLNQLLSNTNGVTVKERIVKGESVSIFFFPSRVALEFVAMFMALEQVHMLVGKLS